MNKATLASVSVAAVTVASGLGLLAATSAAAPSLPTIDLALTPTTVHVSGATVSGAVNVVTTVTGEASDGPTLFRLNPGITQAEFNAAASALGPNTGPSHLSGDRE